MMNADESVRPLDSTAGQRRDIMLVRIKDFAGTPNACSATKCACKTSLQSAIDLLHFSRLVQQTNGNHAFWRSSPQFCNR